jgi:hypothetical protein
MYTASIIRIRHVPPYKVESVGPEKREKGPKKKKRLLRHIQSGAIDVILSALPIFGGCVYWLVKARYIQVNQLFTSSRAYK